MIMGFAGDASGIIVLLNIGGVQGLRMGPLVELATGLCVLFWLMAL